MIELGQLEENHAEFAKRGVRVAAISLDNLENSRAMQKDFPHLILISDTERKLAEAFQVIHPHSDMEGRDTTAPTTFLVDGSGIIRWVFRPENFLRRLSPAEVLQAVDSHR